jgi:hypothetical protein
MSVALPQTCMSDDPTPTDESVRGTEDRESEADRDPADRETEADEPLSEPGAGDDEGGDAPETDVDADGATDEPTESGRDADGAADESGGAERGVADDDPSEPDIPEDVQAHARFTKMDAADYERVNEFLRDRTYITAREWAIARLCADFRTDTGVEMTKIGENLPRLVPFMTDTYSPQAVNQARASFEEKVTKAGATFLYGAMSGFFTAEELDETMYEVTEIAKFLLEVEGVDLSVEEELAAEDEISRVMRDVREASAEVRGEEVKCPECGHVHETD